MADTNSYGTPDESSWYPVVLPGWRLHPILRPILYLFIVPLTSIACALAFEVRLGEGYGKVYPGAIATILVFSLLMVHYTDRRPLRSFGLALNWLALRDFGIGLLIPAVQLGLIFGIERVMGYVRIVSFAWDSHVLGLALQRWVAVAFLEELEARGYIFQSLERLGGRYFGPLLALASTSLYFGYAHGDNPHASPMAVASLVVVGLELGVAYLVTRRLWLPIAMHFGWNLIQGTVLGFPVSGMLRPSFLVIEQGGPDAWTGGAFGPEAGYLCPIFSLIDIGVMLWLAWRGFWKPNIGPVEAEILANPPRLQDSDGITFLDQEGPSRSRAEGVTDESHPRNAGSENLNSASTVNSGAGLGGPDAGPDDAVVDGDGGPDLLGGGSRGLDGDAHLVGDPGQEVSDGLQFGRVDFGELGLHGITIEGNCGNEVAPGHHVAGEARSILGGTLTGG